MTILRRLAALSVGGLMIGVLFAAWGGAPEEADPSLSNRTLEVPGFQHLKSGELEVVLNINGSGQESNLYSRVLGTFLGAGRNSLPQIDFGVEANGYLEGKPVNIDTALIATRDRAVFTYRGDTFETEHDTS